MANAHDQEKALASAIDDVLSRNFIKFAAVGGERIKKDNWECYRWQMTLTSPRGEISCPYHMGLAHVMETKAGSVRPRPPVAWEVLHALLIDANSVADTVFAEWCANFGYDTDSRKALATYLECQETANALRRVFTREQLAELRAVFEEHGESV